MASDETDPCKNKSIGNGDPLPSNTEQRRSERKRKDRLPLFSPDDFDSKRKTASLSATPTSPSVISKKRRIVRQKYPSASAADRPFDVLPNGQPFNCDLCQSPYVCNPLLSKGGSRGKRSRHMPIPRQKLNPTTGKLLTLCNACCQSLEGPRPAKPVVQVSPEQKEAYIAEAKAFACDLAQRLQDPEAERFYCPGFNKTPCRCLQKYIGADGNADQMVERGRELLALHKQSRKLAAEKVYNLDKLVNKRSSKKQTPPYGSIGLGNGHKRSKRFETFVLQQRKRLKHDLHLCEKATQRILCYSNNFLHKKLKTEERGRRAERQKGKAALGLLDPLESLGKRHCCVDRCVGMVYTHKNLLSHWRRRAMTNQREARRVLAEMLTPSGGMRCNCYKFIGWVTGCSHSTISKVRAQMQRTKGDREPPLHGLYSFWEQKTQHKKRETESSATVTQDTEGRHSTNRSRSYSETSLVNSTSSFIGVTGGTLSLSAILDGGMESQGQQMLQLQDELLQQQSSISQQQQMIQQQMSVLGNMQQQWSWTQNASTMANIQQQVLQQMTQLHTVQQQLAASIHNLQQQLASLQPVTQIPVAQIPAPQIPAVQMPATQIPVCQVPAAQVPSLQMPVAKISAAQIPASQVPAQVPNAPLPVGQMPSVQMPAAFPAAANTAVPPNTQLCAALPNPPSGQVIAGLADPSNTPLSVGFAANSQVSTTLLPSISGLPSAQLPVQLPCNPSSTLLAVPPIINPVNAQVPTQQFINTASALCPGQPVVSVPNSHLSSQEFVNPPNTQVPVEYKGQSVPTQHVPQFSSHLVGFGSSQTTMPFNPQAQTDLQSQQSKSVAVPQPATGHPPESVLPVPQPASSLLCPAQISPLCPPPSSDLSAAQPDTPHQLAVTPNAQSGSWNRNGLQQQSSQNMLEQGMCGQQAQSVVTTPATQQPLCFSSSVQDPGQQPLAVQQSPYQHQKQQQQPLVQCIQVSQQISQEGGQRSCAQPQWADTSCQPPSYFSCQVFQAEASQYRSLKQVESAVEVSERSMHQQNVVTQQWTMQQQQQQTVTVGQQVQQCQPQPPPPSHPVVVTWIQPGQSQQQSMSLNLLHQTAESSQCGQSSAGHTLQSSQPVTPPQPVSYPQQSQTLTLQQLSSPNTQTVDSAQSQDQIRLPSQSLQQSPQQKEQQGAQLQDQSTHPAQPQLDQEHQQLFRPPPYRTRTGRHSKTGFKTSLPSSHVLDSSEALDKCTKAPSANVSTASSDGVDHLVTGTNVTQAAVPLPSPQRTAASLDSQKSGSSRAKACKMVSLGKGNSGDTTQSGIQGYQTPITGMSHTEPSPALKCQGNKKVAQTDVPLSVKISSSRPLSSVCNSKPGQSSVAGTSRTVPVTELLSSTDPASSPQSQPAPSSASSVPAQPLILTLPPQLMPTAGLNPQPIILTNAGGNAPTTVLLQQPVDLAQLLGQPVLATPKNIVNVEEDKGNNGRQSHQAGQSEKVCARQQTHTGKHVTVDTGVQPSGKSQLGVSKPAVLPLSAACTTPLPVPPPVGAPIAPSSSLTPLISNVITCCSSLVSQTMSWTVLGQVVAPSTLPMSVPASLPQTVTWTVLPQSVPSVAPLTAASASVQPSGSSVLLPQTVLPAVVPQPSNVIPPSILFSSVNAALPSYTLSHSVTSAGQPQTVLSTAVSKSEGKAAQSSLGKQTPKRKKMTVAAKVAAVVTTGNEELALLGSHSHRTSAAQPAAAAEISVVKTVSATALPSSVTTSTALKTLSSGRTLVPVTKAPPFTTLVLPVAGGRPLIQTNPSQTVLVSLAPTSSQVTTVMSATSSAPVRVLSSEGSSAQGATSSSISSTLPSVERPSVCSQTCVPAGPPLRSIPTVLMPVPNQTVVSSAHILRNAPTVLIPSASVTQSSAAPPETLGSDGKVGAKQPSPEKKAEDAASPLPTSHVNPAPSATVSSAGCPPAGRRPRKKQGTREQRKKVSGKSTATKPVEASSVSRKNTGEVSVPIKVVSESCYPVDPLSSTSVTSSDVAGFSENIMVSEKDFQLPCGDASTGKGNSGSSCKGNSVSDIQFSEKGGEVSALVRAPVPSASMATTTTVFCGRPKQAARIKGKRAASSLQVYLPCDVSSPPCAPSSCVPVGQGKVPSAGFGPPAALSGIQSFASSPPVSQDLSSQQVIVPSVAQTLPKLTVVPSCLQNVTPSKQSLQRAPTAPVPIVELRVAQTALSTSGSSVVQVSEVPVQSVKSSGADPQLFYSPPQATVSEMTSASESVSSSPVMLPSSDRNGSTIMKQAPGNPQRNVPQPVSSSSVLAGSEAALVRSVTSFVTLSDSDGRFPTISPSTEVSLNSVSASTGASVHQLSHMLSNKRKVRSNSTPLLQHAITSGPTLVVTSVHTGSPSKQTLPISSPPTSIKVTSQTTVVYPQTNPTLPVVSLVTCPQQTTRLPQQAVSVPQEVPISPGTQSSIPFKVVTSQSQLLQTSLHGQIPPTPGFPLKNTALRTTQVMRHTQKTKVLSTTSGVLDQPVLVPSGAQQMHSLMIPSHTQKIHPLPVQTTPTGFPVTVPPIQAVLQQAVPHIQKPMPVLSQAIPSSCRATPATSQMIHSTPQSTPETLWAIPTMTQATPTSRATSPQQATSAASQPTHADSQTTPSPSQSIPPPQAMPGGFPVSVTPVGEGKRQMMCITSPMNLQQLQVLLSHLKLPAGCVVKQICSPVKGKGSMTGVGLAEITVPAPSLPASSAAPESGLDREGSSLSVMKQLSLDTVQGDHGQAITSGQSPILKADSEKGNGGIRVQRKTSNISGRNSSPGIPKTLPSGNVTPPASFQQSLTDGHASSISEATLPEVPLPVTMPMKSRKVRKSKGSSGTTPVGSLTCRQDSARPRAEVVSAAGEQFFPKGGHVSETPGFHSTSALHSSPSLSAQSDPLHYSKHLKSPPVMVEDAVESRKAEPAPSSMHAFPQPASCADSSQMMIVTENAESSSSMSVSRTRNRWTDSVSENQESEKFPLGASAAYFNQAFCRGTSSPPGPDVPACSDQIDPCLSHLPRNYVSQPPGDDFRSLQPEPRSQPSKPKYPNHRGSLSSKTTTFATSAPANREAHPVQGESDDSLEISQDANQNFVQIMEKSDGSRAEDATTDSPRLDSSLSPSAAVGMNIRQVVTCSSHSTSALTARSKVHQSEMPKSSSVHKSGSDSTSSVSVPHHLNCDSMSSRRSAVSHFAFDSASSAKSNAAHSVSASTTKDRNCETSGATTTDSSNISQHSVVPHLISDNEPLPRSSGSRLSRSDHVQTIRTNTSHHHSAPSVVPTPRNSGHLMSDNVCMVRGDDTHHWPSDLAAKSATIPYHFIPDSASAVRSSASHYSVVNAISAGRVNSAQHTAHDALYEHRNTTPHHVSHDTNIMTRSNIPPIYGDAAMTTSFFPDPSAAGISNSSSNVTLVFNPPHADSLPVYTTATLDRLHTASPAVLLPPMELDDASRDVELLSGPGFFPFLSTSSRSRNSSGASSIEPTITIDPALLPYDLMQIMTQQGLALTVTEVVPSGGSEDSG